MGTLPRRGNRCKRGKPRRGVGSKSCLDDVTLDESTGDIQIMILKTARMNTIPSPDKTEFSLYYAHDFHCLYAPFVHESAYTSYDVIMDMRLQCIIHYHTHINTYLFLQLRIIIIWLCLCICLFFKF